MSWFRFSVNGLEQCFGLSNFLQGFSFKGLGFATWGCSVLVRLQGLKLRVRGVECSVWGVPNLQASSSQITLNPKPPTS